MSAVLPSRVDVAASPNRAVASVSGQDRVVGAIERLALSRERLRSTMMPAPQKSTSHACGADTGSSRPAWPTVSRICRGAMLLDAVRTWWAQHPLRTASLVAAEASRKLRRRWPNAIRSP
jgi:hypothetical protein